MERDDAAARSAEFHAGLYRGRARRPFRGQGEYMTWPSEAIRQLTIGLRRPNLHRAYRVGRSSKMSVKADERFAPLVFCEMERVGEIHPLRHPIQCLSSQGRGFQRNARKPCKGGQSTNDPIAAEPISA